MLSADVDAGFDPIYSSEIKLYQTLNNASFLKIKGLELQNILELLEKQMVQMQMQNLLHM